MATEITYPHPDKLQKIDQVGDPIKIIQGQRKMKETPTDIPNYDRYTQSLNFADKHDKIQDRVKSILMFDKFARKNDIWLMLLYYHKMGWITLKVDIHQFNEINPPESISRARRRIYEEIRQGKHLELKSLIDKDIEQIRGNQEELYHNYYKDKNNEEKVKEIK